MEGRGARDHDEGGHDGREQRPVDEEIGDHDPALLLGAAAVVPAGAASAAVLRGAASPSRPTSATLTTAPGCTFMIPSTTTRSPAANPPVTTTSLPEAGPSFTGRGAIFESGPTTHTNVPWSRCITARFGITIVPASVTPSIRARTTCPGNRAPLLLSTTARTSTVPVESPTLGAMNSIRALSARVCPSISTTRTLTSPGLLLATAARKPSASASGTEKSTYSWSV